jgi:GNAT superfamily N-acetyltransferase
MLAGVTLPGVAVRAAGAADARSVAELAEQFAVSFPFSPAAFQISFAHLLDTPQACLLVADDHGRAGGYLLGFAHPTFFAGGPVAWLEEVMVAPQQRRAGLGRALVTQFEHWAAGRGCRLVALATRRAEPFYRALGYAPSATYLRKQLPGRAP